MRESAGNGIFLSCTKESLRNAEKIGKGVTLVNNNFDHIRLYDDDSRSFGS